MLVKIYRNLKAAAERDRLRREAGEIGPVHYWLMRISRRFLIQIIIFPHWILLGPFKTFTQFARKDEGGAWIDSYDQFVISNRVTLQGVFAVLLIAVLAVVVFIYLPIIYI